MRVRCVRVVRVVRVMRVMRVVAMRRVAVKNPPESPVSAHVDTILKVATIVELGAGILVGHMHAARALISLASNGDDEVHEQRKKWQGQTR